MYLIPLEHCYILVSPRLDCCRFLRELQGLFLADYNVLRNPERVGKCQHLVERKGNLADVGEAFGSELTAVLAF